ncbi:uncharacterized protein LOC112600483 isoform X2 [Melanaphis sacchari]|uniref:uncharacterized protein LOC112600483 isoform X2 n=1 Tax=Melanaphis sacchari TaxID=742174 RepID=UPI000DC14588|nr:uncharacterized protein LOC112600483 isoform X2 [Melanaphis sacchari]
MTSPRSVAATDLNEVNDCDLDDLGSTLDIVHEIDKFLEGLSSDGADLPVNNDKKIDEIKTTDLEVVNNNRTPTTQMDVEFVGKNPAVFQLLEDHENYGVYEHNPNECNWNVFYKTLPPDDQTFVKVEPKTEIVNDYFLNDSDNKLESFSFNLDNTPEKSIFEQHSSEASNGATTSEITHSDNELENFSFTLKADNIKNTLRKPNPWYRKDSTERNNALQQTFKNQYQGNASLPSAPNNNGSTFFPPRNYNSQPNRGNSNNFKKMPNEIQGNKNVAPNASFTRNDNELANFQFGKNNSQLTIPKHDESPPLNVPRPLRHPPVPIIKPHSLVGEYLSPVSLVGTTIKFLSRKLANTSIREQIVIELAKHGILENNWWTPDDMFYATFSERSIAQHVFKMYPQNTNCSY